MALVPGIARRVGANFSRTARLAIGRAVLGRRAPFWLRLALEPPLEEVAGPRLPFARLRGPSLLDALRALEAAASDPRVAGVVLRLAGAPQGFAAAASLRRAVDGVRAAGKRVVAYGERIGQAEYQVGSGAEKLFLPETGAIHLVGLRSESLFFPRLLERLALRPEVLRVGAFKSAGEPLTRRSLSLETRTQLEAYLDDVLDQLVAAIAAGRRLGATAVRDAIDRGPHRAASAIEAGLADGCRHLDEVEDALVEMEPDTAEASARESEPARPRLVDAPVYTALHASDAGFAPWHAKQARIAYVVAEGAIHRRGPRGISAETMSRLLRAIGEDDAVRAIVVRIDSPGGDALASDVVWRALEVAGRGRPVVVSMGEVAASGGYFAAVAGDAIFAEAATLTGSIGVAGGKLDAGAALEKLGVDTDAVERGARAGLYSATRGWSAEEKAVVKSDMEAVYEIFVRRVAEGRGIERDAVERVAQGRIWSGTRALANGLVDAIGGPLEAIREARARAGLAAAERAVLDAYPRIAALGTVRGLLGVETRI